MNQLSIALRKIGTAPDNFRFRVIVGILHALLGHRQRFLEEEGVVIRQAADNGYYRKELAMAHFALGEFERGVELAREAAALGFLTTNWEGSAHLLINGPIREIPGMAGFLEENDRACDGLGAGY